MRVSKGWNTNTTCGPGEGVAKNIMKRVISFLVFVPSFLAVTQTKTTQSRLKEILERSLKSPDDYPGLSQLLSRAIQTNRSQMRKMKLNSFFQPAEQIQPRQLQTSPPCRTPKSISAAIQLTRPKRKPVLLDVRIPSSNTIQQLDLPIIPSELSNRPTDLLNIPTVQPKTPPALSNTPPDLPHTLPALPNPPPDLPNTPPDQQNTPPVQPNTQTIQPKTPPVQHSYLSTLYLSDVNTVSPDGLRPDNSNNNQSYNQNNMKSFHPDDPNNLKADDIKPISSNGIDPVNQDDNQFVNSNDLNSVTSNNEKDLRNVMPGELTNVSPNEQATVLSDGLKNTILNELTTVIPNDMTTVYADRTNAESVTQQLETVGITTPETTTTLLASRESRENNLENSPSPCYTHTMTWLGRCVVLCDKMLVRPCLFYSEEQ